MYHDDSKTDDLKLGDSAFAASPVCDPCSFRIDPLDTQRWVTVNELTDAVVDV